MFSKIIVVLIFQQPCPTGSTKYRDFQCKKYSEDFVAYYRGGNGKYINKKKHQFITSDLKHQIPFFSVSVVVGNELASYH